ncbi:MAG: hypothetical protein ACRC4M_00075, partial [Mycoplasma sp.]
GDCPKLNMKFNDFYHKKLKHGDKIWIHNSEVLDLDEMKTFYIQNENSYDDSYWVCYLWPLKIIKIISDNKVNKTYDNDGITNSIMKIKRKNPYTTYNSCAIYINKAKGFLWLILNYVRLGDLYKMHKKTISKQNVYEKTIVTKKMLRRAQILTFIFVLPIKFLCVIFRRELN